VSRVSSGAESANISGPEPEFSQPSGLLTTFIPPFLGQMSHESEIHIG
jgi:hypothetical protein